MMSLRISRSRGKSLSASRVSMFRAPPRVGTLHTRVLSHGTRKGPGSQAGGWSQTIDLADFGGPRAQAAARPPKREKERGAPPPAPLRPPSSATSLFGDQTGLRRAGGDEIRLALSSQVPFVQPGHQGG